MASIEIMKSKVSKLVAVVDHASRFRHNYIAREMSKAQNGSSPRTTMSYPSLSLLHYTCTVARFASSGKASDRCFVDLRPAEHLLRLVNPGRMLPTSRLYETGLAYDDAHLRSHSCP